MSYPDLVEKASAYEELVDCVNRCSSEVREEIKQELEDSSNGSSIQV